MTTKSALIQNYYNQLEILNKNIEERKIIYDVPAHLLKPTKLKDKDGNEYLEFPEYNETDYPIKIGNYASSKETDIITKYTNSIQKLEGETSVGETVQIAMTFCEYVRDFDFEMSQKISEYFDMFIRQLLK